MFRSDVSVSEDIVKIDRNDSDRLGQRDLTRTTRASEWSRAEFYGSDPSGETEEGSNFTIISNTFSTIQWPNIRKNELVVHANLQPQYHWHPQLPSNNVLPRFGGEYLL